MTEELRVTGIKMFPALRDALWISELRLKLYVCSDGIYPFQTNYKANRCTNPNVKALGCSFNVVCCRVPLERSPSSSITFK